MRHRFSVLFAAAPALTILGFIMAADLVFTMCGLVADRRVITGAPAWLKPAKFTLSTMIAAWSFAFCIASTRIWPRVTRALDMALATGLFIEIALIDIQAARGTTSHFNVSTPLDGAVWAVMGVSILCIWLAMLLLTVVLFRQPYASPA
jgi:tellurite resistance protein TehA-like permease